jgi:hypothetical protein
MQENMSDEQDKFLKEYDRRYERMRNTLLGVVFILIAAILGSWYLIGKSQGKVEANINEINNSLKFVSRDYAPAWYIKGITDLYTLNTEKIVAVLNNSNQDEIKRIDIDFQKTVDIMQDQFILIRGGMNNTTRSVKNEPEK